MRSAIAVGALIIVVLMIPLVRQWLHGQQVRSQQEAVLRTFQALGGHTMPADLVVFDTSATTPPAQAGYSIATDTMGTPLLSGIQYRPPAWDAFLAQRLHFGGMGYNPQGAIAFVGQRQAAGQSPVLLVITATPGLAKRPQIRAVTFDLDATGMPSAKTLPGGYESVLACADGAGPYKVCAGQADSRDTANVIIPVNLDGIVTDIHCRLQPDGTTTFSASRGTVVSYPGRPRGQDLFIGPLPKTLDGTVRIEGLGP